MGKINDASADSNQGLSALLDSVLKSSPNSSTSFHTSTTSLTSQTNEDVQEILNKDPKATETMASKVHEYISSHKVVMFGKPGCTFCVKAKNALAKSGCKLIKWVNVAEKPDERDLMLAVLADMTKRKLTTPKVFIRGNFIGGGNDCERLYKQGILKKMLEED